MDKKFTNPSTNAKGCGVILIIFAIFGFWSTVFGNSFVANSAPNINLLSVADILITVITGYGLFNKKLYGIYGLGLIFLVDLGLFIYNLGSGFTFLESLNANLIILPIFIAWFWSGKKEFS